MLENEQRNAKGCVITTHYQVTDTDITDMKAGPEASEGDTPNSRNKANMPSVLMVKSDIV